MDRHIVKGGTSARQNFFTKLENHPKKKKIDIGKDLFSEKTVLSPNYRPPKGADAATRKQISFNSPHNLGGLKKFIFPGEK